MGEFLRELHSPSTSGYIRSSQRLDQTGTDKKKKRAAKTKRVHSAEIHGGWGKWRWRGTRGSRARRKAEAQTCTGRYEVNGPRMPSKVWQIRLKVDGKQFTLTRQLIYIRPLSHWQLYGCCCWLCLSACLRSIKHENAKLHRVPFVCVECWIISPDKKACRPISIQFISMDMPKTESTVYIQGAAEKFLTWECFSCSCVIRSNFMFAEQQTMKPCMKKKALYCFILLNNM